MTKDIGQDIYTNYIMDTQVSLFRYSEIAGAKKLCKCGCSQQVKGWNYDLQKAKEYIHRHNKGRLGKHNSERMRKKISDALFRRDNYTCQECFNKQDLEPHHIYQFSKYPELRFDVNNGITLCIKCHNKTKSKEQQFAEYFKNKLKRWL